MALKSLKPSMREKKRYLLLKGNNLNEDVEKTILDFIGILGMSKAGFKWIKRGKNSAIISVNREMMNEVRASFSASKNDIVVEKVSGSLKKLKK
ncbi:MAG: hypothetical protein A2639_00480 [Candidatus Staskawiczbacteria bacterium RIFCSPHIGHO2_01_FULL_34_27]|uniref:Uncharacterized protein n=1 Tax=Candidatus Staskawiczbacteria bacterium RIFCSPHIGHO2_01_FULL_34_27 TaxID=1802199 RepID=A0A1G2HJ79_9BACT|nr:hypothetical protein [Candidatus Pacearchaeota archaeon]OGZ62546.1 MAG: hypothetical protein A2639_00480 [Candidatus Staskawiczbacteria bacterium RIFCSPHIGHO2_01_FULL_34_27]